MNGQRKHYIDYLRVTAFLILIFYHTGMFFVPWDFHFKNPETSEWFETWMAFLSQWRLPLLFTISGMGAFFAMRSRTKGSFFLERINRLFVPLAFGMFVIVPPQIYFEHLYKGVHYNGYLDFYRTVFDFISYPQGSLSWHHLWYVAYIFVYSIICIPLLSFLKSSRSEGFRNGLTAFFSRPGRLYYSVIPLALIYSTLGRWFPTTHALIDDWYNFTFSLTFFIYGMLIASSDKLWDSLERQRKLFLYMALIPSLLLILFVWGPTFYVMNEDTMLFEVMYGVLKITLIPSVIFSAFGYAKKYLNRPGKFISYANEAVYPMFILHQTVMLAGGYYIVQAELGIAVKFVLTVVLTFGGSLVLYELFIKPFGVMRYLFGMKKKHGSSELRVKSYNTSGLMD